MQPRQGCVTLARLGRAQRVRGRSLANAAGGTGRPGPSATRLHCGTAEGCDEATRLPTAYKIATVLDPKRPDAMLKRLFEMKR